MTNIENPAALRTPEAGETALPPEIAAFQGHVGPEIESFGVLHGWTGGVNTIDGTVSEASLSSALQGATEAAQRDPAILALMGAVNRDYDARQQAAAESGQPKRPASVTRGPAFGILKQYGAAVPRPERPQEVATDTDHSPRQHAAPRIGHRIFADGHVIDDGLIVPGRNEVMTPRGIVRTRGTPRTSL